MVIGEPLLERLAEGVAATRRAADEMEAARELLLGFGIEPRIVGASAASSPNSLPAGSRTGARVHAMTRQQSGVRRPATAPGLVCGGGRPARPRRSGRAPAADRRSRARQRFSELGLAGFALKSHYTSTAERAQVVSALFSEVEVGTPNWAVGGMNASPSRSPRVRAPGSSGCRRSTRPRRRRGDRAEGRGQGSPVGTTSTSFEASD